MSPKVYRVLARSTQQPHLHYDTIGNMPAGRIFVGEIYTQPPGPASLPQTTGVLMVVAENGRHNIVDLATGRLYTNCPYVGINDDAIPSLEAVGC